MVISQQGCKCFYVGNLLVHNTIRADIITLAGRRFIVAHNVGLVFARACTKSSGEIFNLSDKLPSARTNAFKSYQFQCNTDHAISTEYVGQVAWWYVKPLYSDGLRIRPRTNEAALESHLSADPLTAVSYNSLYNENGSCYK